MTKFALHPGKIISRFDGQMHHITGTQLAELYQLRRDEYVIWQNTPEFEKGRNYKDYIHLYPNTQGDYGRHNAEKAREAQS